MLEKPYISTSHLKSQEKGESMVKLARALNNVAMRRFWYRLNESIHSERTFEHPTFDYVLRSSRL